MIIHELIAFYHINKTMFKKMQPFKMQIGYYKKYNNIRNCSGNESLQE